MPLLVSPRRSLLNSETRLERGICRAPRVLVDVGLVSFTSGRRARMDSKTFSKVLHLAMFHGWTPERLTAQPPSASSDTEIIVPYIEPYLFGSVSHTDAEALAAGLMRMLDSEAFGLPAPVHFAAISILALAECGAFGVVAESAAGQPDGSSTAATHGGQTHAPLAG